MRNVLALLAAAALSMAAHAVPLNTIEVDGVLNRPTFDDLYDPSAGNALLPWVGSGFSASLSWSPATLLAVDSDGDDEHERVWAFQGRGGFTVDGHSPALPDLTYVAVQRHFVYDGSAGILPAGTYEVLSLFGAQFCTASTGPSYFGECLTETGVPRRENFSFDLIGSPGMLGGLPGELPLASEIHTDRVLAVMAGLDHYDNNTQLIGGLASVNTGADRLDHLRLMTVAVPEPGTAALGLLGLASLALWRRRRGG